MIHNIHNQIKTSLQNIGIISEVELSTPPNTDMGDIAMPCFAMAKEGGKNPAEVAKDIVEKLQDLYTKENMKQSSLVKEVKAFGPYVNFFLDEKELAQFVIDGIQTQKKQYGTHDIGKAKKYLVEFGCPNPMKAFHLGHLRNLISGESVARILTNAGYDVKRTNYQGDVGMHISKTLWGIEKNLEQFDAVKEKSVKERVEFLGQAYATGATAYEKDNETQQEIRAYNEVVYGERPIRQAQGNKDEKVMKIYTEARQWSLDYFETIYKKLGSGFDCYYFESETAKRGVEIVKENLEKGIFKKSEGAIIFEGSKEGLHDRVFINSKGYPTYEAKDLALAEKHWQDHRPDKIIHVVGKEQTEYFKVIFAAMKHVLPEVADKEHHLIGGYLQLKGDQKMSSRTGKIITGDQLVEQIEEKIDQIMQEHTEQVHDPEKVKKAVAVAALKYTMLSVYVSKDLAFDMESSVSTSGESGPYLLYIGARIHGILQKVGKPAHDVLGYSGDVATEEKQLLLHLAAYPNVTAKAAETYDSSGIAQYVFDLAQKFNSFYANCPVSQAEEPVKSFRIHLIQSVLQVMEQGLDLLGIEMVEEM